MTLPAQDIVERLRAHAAECYVGSRGHEWATEAADTISRLTADNEALRKHVAFLRDALGMDRTSIWRDAKLSASTEEAIEAVLEWSADSARVTALEADVGRLREALDDMLFEYGDKYDNECRLKNTSELDMIAKARAALGGSDHG